MSVVVDASAVLAFLGSEAGADIVAQHLPGAIISAINLAEVATKLTDHGLTESATRDVLFHLGLNVVPVDEETAYAIAALRPLTRNAGLSLGDRGCLALARARAWPALTADRSWARLDIGIEIQLIR